MTRPGFVAFGRLAAFIANPVLQIVGALAVAWLGRRRELTVGLISGNCNMGLLLAAFPPGTDGDVVRSEEHTSELQSLMRISYAVFGLKKKKHTVINVRKHTSKYYMQIPHDI